MDPLALTIAETARMLGLSRATVYSLTRSGDLPSIKIGRAVRVPINALNEWLAARTEGSAIDKDPRQGSSASPRRERAKR